MYYHSRDTSLPEYVLRKPRVSQSTFCASRDRRETRVKNAKKKKKIRKSTENPKSLMSCPTHNEDFWFTLCLYYIWAPHVHMLRLVSRAHTHAPQKEERRFKPHYYVVAARANICRQTRSILRVDAIPYRQRNQGEWRVGKAHAEGRLRDIVKLCLVSHSLPMDSISHRVVVTGL